MQTEFLGFPHDIYNEKLAIILGINFSEREISVMACRLYGYKVKEIAQVLSLSPKTVEYHIRNISQRIGGGSQEIIADFIRKAEEYTTLKTYYSALKVEYEFEKILLVLSKWISPIGITCKLHYRQEQEKASFFSQLNKHFSQEGLQVIKELESENSFQEFLVTWKSLSDPSHLSDESILFEENNDYYLTFFEFLKKLLPTHDVEKFRSDFVGIRKNIILNSTINGTKLNTYFQKNRLVFNLAFIQNIFVKNKFILFCCLLALLFGLVMFSYAFTKTKSPIIAVRADLILPSEFVLLNRPELLNEIEDKFSKQNEIKNIAIIGPGGAGKTTLARQYAYGQKVNVIWEINAETQNSILISFEKLANALAKTEEDKKVLINILETTNTDAKEEEIIQFVRDHLSKSSPWLLIYDNVEKFSDIHKYFPYDYKVWSYGSIIITTRDTSLGNNQHIKNTLSIGELDSTQKLKLFTSIISKENKKTLTKTQAKDVSNFLKEIPPYPLDISVAGYYLNTTKISYSHYLDMLLQNNEDFYDVQENLLKESGNYVKTRYRIINASLQKLLKEHKDFPELLLFISMLSSQDIPVELLKRLKNEAVVDNLIYNLKKYSLIREENLKTSLLGHTFSIHRTTQSIILAYLLKNSRSEENLKAITELSNIVVEHLSSLVDKEDCLKMKGIVQHCEKFLGHEIVQKNHRRIPIENELGILNYYLNDFIKARSILERNIEISRLEPNTIGMARALGTLGSIYRYLGKYKESKELLEKSLQIFKQISINNIGAARSLSWLGVVYRFFGEYENAKKFIQQSIVTFNNLSENHPGVAWGIARLGFIYRDLGEDQKAKRYLEEALTRFKKNEQSHVAGGVNQTLVILGVIHRYLGELEEAKQVFEKCMALNIKDSKNSIWLARATTELGSIYRDEGDYEKSLNFFEKALAIYKNDFPDNYVWIAHSMVNLGIIHELLGHHEKAKQLIEEGIKTYEEHLPKNHIWIAKASGWLGQIYLELGDYVKAKALLEHDLEIYKKYYPCNHTALAWCYAHIADLYNILGDKTNATLFQKKYKDMIDSRSNNKSD